MIPDRCTELVAGNPLFDGLKALAEAAFPKKCRGCGRTFDSAEQFLHETDALRQGVSGLKQSIDDDASTIVEVYRNCSCGSTLMDFFSNRRDASAAGVHRPVRQAHHPSGKQGHEPRRRARLSAGRHARQRCLLIPS